jgi:signal transduction histidine kinase
MKIFQPNFTTKKGGLSFGLGLGLSIVQRLIDSYNGKIKVDSKKGNTKFTIQIPV